MPAVLQLVGANVDVTQRPGWEAETAIAVNPTNPNIAVEVSTAVSLKKGNSVGLLEATTAANPAGWTANLIATGADSLGAYAGDPHVAYDDKYGNLFLAYVGLNVAQNGTASKNAGAQNFTDATRNWTQRQWNDTILSISSGAAKGLVRGVVSNTRDTLQLVEKWSKTPIAGDSYSILLAAPFFKDGKEVVRGVDSVTGTTLNYRGGLLPAFDAEGGNFYVKIIAGEGRGQVRRIKSVNPFQKTLQVNEAWSVKPGRNSKFQILESDPKNTHSVELYQSTNNGNSFQFLARPAIGDLDFPNIATGPAGKNKPNERSVWTTWSDLTFHKVKAGGLLITGSGKFGKFTSMFVAKDSQFSSIAIGPEGQVAVAYDVLSNNRPTNIVVNTDVSGLNGVFGRPPVGVTSSWLSSARDTSAALAQPDRGIQLLPTLAWDVSGKINKGRDGRLYLAYEFVQNAAALNNHNIVIHSIYSDDGGKGWKGDKAVNNLGGTQFNPAVAVDQATGNVAFTWYEAPNPMNPSVQLYGTASQTGTDGNNAFLTPIQVSKGTSNVKTLAAGYNFDYGEYNGLAYINGVFQASWADNSNSTMNNPNKDRGLDIYTQQVTVVAQKGALETTPGGTVDLGSGTNLTDSATLTGGNNPTGTITFVLYDPNGVVVYSDVVQVNGDGTYSTDTGTNPGGYSPTDVGTYQWVVTYSGDANNSSITSPFGNESEDVQNFSSGISGPFLSASLSTSPSWSPGITLPGASTSDPAPALPTFWKDILSSSAPHELPPGPFAWLARHRQDSGDGQALDALFADPGPGLS